MNPDFFSWLLLLDNKADGARSRQRQFGSPRLCDNTDEVVAAAVDTAPNPEKPRVYRHSGVASFNPKATGMSLITSDTPWRVFPSYFLKNALQSVVALVAELTCMQKALFIERGRAMLQLTKYFGYDQDAVVRKLHKFVSETPKVVLPDNDDDDDFTTTEPCVRTRRYLNAPR